MPSDGFKRWTKGNLVEERRKKPSRNGEGTIAAPAGVTVQIRLIIRLDTESWNSSWSHEQSEVPGQHFAVEEEGHDGPESQERTKGDILVPPHDFKRDQPKTHNRTD